MITVITPTVRPEMLQVIIKCLGRQDFKDFEWIIITPENTKLDLSSCYQNGLSFISAGDPGNMKWLIEPPKREGDFYRLSGALNKGFQESKGELVVVIMDGNWFPPDTLSKFWSHYQANPKGLIGSIGHQYDGLDETGKPTDMMWQDPRARTDLGTFYEVAPSEIEFSMCSIPKQALLDCGGIDEDYDKGPAVGEKEMCWRLDKLGYKFYLDQTIEYRAIHHPRLTNDWDDMYHKVTTPMFIEHMRQLSENRRLLKLDYVK